MWIPIVHFWFWMVVWSPVLHSSLEDIVCSGTFCMICNISEKVYEKQNKSLQQADKNEHYCGFRLCTSGSVTCCRICPNSAQFASSLLMLKFSIWSLLKEIYLYIHYINLLYIYIFIVLAHVEVSIFSLLKKRYVVKVCSVPKRNQPEVAT